MKITKNLGMLLLGIWLVLTGLLDIISLPIPFLDVIMTFLAIAAGILIILDR